MWKDVKGYEGLYQVSDDGRVMNVKRDVLLSPVSDKRGYKVINLSKNNKCKKFPVHRLVAQAFIPNTEGKATVNHIDEDKINNNVCNLEWSSYQENTQHSMLLDAGKVREIVALLEDGVLGKVVAKTYGVTATTISRIKKGQSWANITGIGG